MLYAVPNQGTARAVGTPKENLGFLSSNRHVEFEIWGLLGLGGSVSLPGSIGNLS